MKQSFMCAGSYAFTLHLYSCSKLTLFSLQGRAIFETLFLFQCSIILNVSLRLQKASKSSDDCGLFETTGASCSFREAGWINLESETKHWSVGRFCEVVKSDWSFKSVVWGYVACRYLFKNTNNCKNEILDANGQMSFPRRVAGLSLRDSVLLCV